MLCSRSRDITRHNYKTLTCLCNNETMKQYRSVLRKISQRVIVSQINYLPSFLTWYISRCFASSLLNSLLMCELWSFKMNLKVACEDDSVLCYGKILSQASCDFSVLHRFKSVLHRFKVYTKSPVTRAIWRFESYSLRYSCQLSLKS